MAKICAACRMPVAPVNECICDDDEQDEHPELTPRFLPPPPRPGDDAA